MIHEGSHAYRRPAWSRIRTWAYVHGISGLLLGSIVVAWVASALASSVGIPRLNPSPDLNPADLHTIGIITIAGASGLTSLALVTHQQWLFATSPRRLSCWRLLWSSCVIGGALLLALASVPLLPPQLPAFTGYLAISGIWLGAALIGVVVSGRYGGMFAPLAIATVIMTRVVPWELNVVANGNLASARVITAVILLSAGLLLYALRGSKQT